MTGYLVDTDWIIDCLYGRPDATQTLLDLASDGLAVSLMTYGELYQGAYYARDPQPALRGLRTCLQGKRVLPLNRAILERFGVVRGDLTRRGLTIGDFDILIAATALHHDLTLVTRNRRHFSRVANLRLYARPSEV
jgi:tRNA(fMet)-specific endonuclease VapC